MWFEKRYFRSEAMRVYIFFVLRENDLFLFVIFCIVKETQIFCMKAGIVGFGFALPQGKVKRSTLAQRMGQDPAVFSGLGIESRTVAMPEENTFTLCLRAAKRLLDWVKIEKDDIGYCVLGSETPLYAVNPTSSMVAEFLGISEKAQVFDGEFACKSGTALLYMVTEILAHKKDTLGLVLAGDIGTGKMNDALAYTAGSGGVGFLVGNCASYDVVATIEHMTTVNRHRMDFWRGKHHDAPEHAGRWSGEMYMETVLKGIEQIVQETGKDIASFDHVVLHMPNGKLPARVAKQAGITQEQLKYGWVVKDIGNTYSACVGLGVCNVLSYAKPGEDILVVSYGSGAGSDAFWFRATEHVVTYEGASVFDVVERLPFLEEGNIALSVS